MKKALLILLTLLLCASLLASCGQKGETNDGAGNSEQGQTNNGAGGSEQDDHTHEYATEYSMTTSFHWRYCKHCGEKDSYAEHSMVDGACSVCGTPEASSDGLTYEINLVGQAIVTGYSGNETVVRIPDTYEGHLVTVIGEKAFYNQKDLTSVIIPDKVNSISQSVFAGCSNLTGITFPDGVTYIGGSSFWECTGLKSITIPASVETILSDSFGRCSGIENITVVKGNLRYHGAGNCLIETETKKMVVGCKNSVIPDDGSVTEIDSSAFRGLTSLKSIVIPNSVTSIESLTFEDCSSLESVIFAEGSKLTSIEWSVFSGCESLTSIKIPDSVTSIGTNVFLGCKSLTTIQYGGTTSQWSAVIKGDDWDTDTGKYTVVCTDSTLTKAES